MCCGHREFVLIFQNIEEYNSQLWAQNVAQIGLTNVATWLQDPAFLASNTFQSINGYL